MILTRKDIDPLPETSWVGKILVLNGAGKTLKREFKRAKFQLWRATGGFGCEPGLVGRAVFATCLSDGENARWDRGEFIGCVTEERAKEILEKDT